MSRFTYKSQKEVLRAAKNIRRHKIPCDVLHIDAGWFDHGWRCDFKFGKKTFPDPAGMIRTLKKQGLHTSLWQLPYFTPANALYEEIVRKKLYVQNERGNVPTEDIILDFSNPETIKWYQSKIKNLLRAGVDVIKADFGESAPYEGYYHSGSGGKYEHNLYPLRYTGALSEVVRETTGTSLIWARSAWAGSQRYPVHWSGDPEGTGFSMAATLRAGLSLGLSGFSFWSHDIGGFSSSPDEDLYRRWLVFGMLTSHSRTHGFPPREPWLYSTGFLKDFRRIVGLKYRLLPYIYTQAALSCNQGFPMIRSLFFQYPEDETAWYIEDQYMFGEDVLVAPLLEAGQNQRQVYLPPGYWIDYQDNEIYQGKSWHSIKAGEIPGIILIRNGAVIPEITPGLSTESMNWKTIDLKNYAIEESGSSCVLYLPGDRKIKAISLEKKKSGWVLKRNPYGSKVRFRIMDPWHCPLDSLRQVQGKPLGDL
jgi:alpha-D-xyloside xylohydrolase